MLTKENINNIKYNNENLKNFVKEYANNNGDLEFILKNLGQLPKGFNGEWLLDLFSHKNEKIRSWVVKNIGKLKDDSYLTNLVDLYNNEVSTIVMREIVSSIGRMRTQKGKLFLFEALKSEDPKIVCQAIRGLLFFKGDNSVDNALKNLQYHKNETVKSVISKEYFQKEKTKSSKESHTDVLEFLTNTVVNGDVIEVLKNVPDESFHLTFTSPPYYNARDYSIYPSYEEYLNFLEKVFLEVYRTTKEGRFLIVNTSPVIVPRISRAHSSKRYPIPFDIHYFLTKMGWEFIDDIVWLKPEYSVKNRVGGFHQHRKPLAYKPNSVTEYLMVYRKKTDKLIDWNIKQYSQDIVNNSKVIDSYETSNVWEISPKSNKVHSAIFPTELCQRVIEYYSYKGDLIFDPFGGSGTLARTAKSLDRNFFLTEIDFNYFNYIKEQEGANKLFDKSTFLSLEEFIIKSK